MTPRGGKAVYKSEGHPFVRSQNVGLGHLILDDITYIDEYTHQRQKSTELQLDDVLLNITGASIGRSALVNQQIVGGNVNQHVCIIRANKKLIPSFLCYFLLSQYGQKQIRANKKLIPSFLCYFLLSQYGQKQIESFQAGGNRQGLNFEQIRSIKIGLPSLEEQKKIADLLLLIEQRITTQNKIIEDLRLLRDAISVCLLSSKSDWKCYKVSEIADIGRGRVISSKEIANQNNPQYPVYSSQTSNEGIMGYLDDYAFDGEYITWTTDGANAGTVFYRNGRFNCTNVCGTLRLHYQFDAYYCSLVLANATKKYVSVNLANPKLMNNTMAAIKLYLPPFQEQKRMAQLFRKMDENITLEHKLLLSYQKQKHYLLQQMFI